MRQLFPSPVDLFALLRSPADVVLVAAGTARAEGGPTLNAQLAGAGLLDELCLSLSPRLVGGTAKRILDGLPGPGPGPGPWACARSASRTGFLFLRHRPLDSPAWTP